MNDIRVSRVHNVTRGYPRHLGTRLFLLIATVLLVPVCARAQRYVEIQGRIQTSTYQPGNTSGARQRTISFHCIVGTNQWRIDNDFAAGAEVKWFFDGTNVYDSIHPTNPPPESIAKRVGGLGFATAPIAVAKSNLTITIASTPGGHPLGNVAANLPWLAFCSGTYLRRTGRIIPLPVATLRNAPDGFGYSDHTITFEDEFGLPTKLDLFTSKVLYEQSLRNFAHEQFLQDSGAIPPGFRDGLLKFHYEVIKSTNFLGWSFPLRFEYSQNEISGSGVPILRYAGEGVVTSIQTSTPPDGLFAPALQQTVVDYRFRDTNRMVRSISYTTTNASSQPTNDPRLQSKFASVVARSPQNPPHKARVRLFFLTLLCLGTTLPLFLLFFKSKSTKRDHKNVQAD